MIATPISRSLWRAGAAWRAASAALALGGLLWGAGPGADAASVEEPLDIARQAESVYTAARKKLQGEPNNAEAHWMFGRACYDWADAVTSNGDRAKIAEEGIAACRQLVAQDDKSAPGHYYLAMNYGQLARTKTLGALKLVQQMETEFTKTLELDANFDHAGADRGLGLLYHDAPGWPTSIGSKSKSRTHLQQAIKISPDFPENHLNLIEVQLKAGDRSEALKGLRALDEMWPEARRQFSGPEWAADWADWEKRRRECIEKATEQSRVLQSPRMK